MFKKMIELFDQQYKKLIEFLIRYEYARALFDARAAKRFSDFSPLTVKVFDNLSKTEINHADKLSKLITNKVVHTKKFFLNNPDWGEHEGQYVDGMSKRKIWSRFLFKGRSASEYEVFDVLAFCAVAEFLETIGYSILYLLFFWHQELRTVLACLVKEESNAELKIKEHLRQAVNDEYYYSRLINYWYRRGILSMLILLFTGNK